MATACNDCDDFTCTEKIPTCTTLLNIGFPTDTFTNRIQVYAKKHIGGDEFNQIITIDGYTGGVSFLITDPFFNEFDGLYIVWATEEFADASDEILLEIDEKLYTRFGVEFTRTRGKAFNERTIVPII